MKFSTLNSAYEVDTAAKRIRRVSGSGEPTARFTPSGDWKDYAELPGGVEISFNVLIVWPDGKATLTSRVAAIESGAVAA